MSGLENMMHDRKEALGRPVKTRHAKAGHRVPPHPNQQVTDWIPLRGVTGLASDSKGQGSVEFALVCVAFLGIIVALGVLWQALRGGLFVDHALASASHHIQSVSAGVVGDVFLY